MTKTMMRSFLLSGLSLLFIGSALAQTQTWTLPGPASGTGYPLGAQPFTASASAAATSATVTVTPPTGKTVYVCGIVASENAGTGQTTVGSVTNLLGPALTAVTMSFWYPGTFSATAGANFFDDLLPCAPGMPNTAVVATTPVATLATASTIYVTGYFY
jgi:hypothetical protein